MNVSSNRVPTFLKKCINNSTHILRYKPLYYDYDDLCSICNK